MRNAPRPRGGSWQTFVLEARMHARYSQQGLADALGVNKTTVWRWENEDRRPESSELAVKLAIVTRQDPEQALRAAGFALWRVPDEDPRLEGLNPHDPVVRHILDLDVDEEMRGMMLDRYRQNLERDRQRYLEQADADAEFFRRRAAG